MSDYVLVTSPVCTCGHLLWEHRIDIKSEACCVGCGVPNLQCPCPKFEEVKP